MPSDPPRSNAWHELNAERENCAHTLTSATTPAGDKLPEGRYSFRTESMFNGEIISTRAVAAYSRVTETEMGDEGAVLVLTGGVSVPASAVESLREAR
ncbi:hypothetical protein SAMN04489859_10102 [Paracoccus alcaliphilus]|uniref:Uncharacterized protein n=2 Tax=Paracoccus alcaliphilus TaxID=34002 RepID=A0A1H8HMS5_9RHOB|nr:hypothetical protein SAMN04489859_10102 [Paracoccus alcaliphilus]